MNTINNKNFFCSWSGGKDSCLALFEAIQMGGIPKALVTMMIEDNKRSRSHGLPVEVLKKQAESLNIPLYVYSTSWDNYEDVFKGAIRSLKEEGVEWGVFGDIDLEPHLEWVERVCNSENVTAFEPLWKKKRMDLLTRFIDLDFSTTVISIKEEKLKRSFLGRILDLELIEDFIKVGIDASGEEGEYHTVVTNGPIFKEEIEIQLKEQISRSGYCFQNVELINNF